MAIQATLLQKTVLLASLVFFFLAAGHAGWSLFDKQGDTPPPPPIKSSLSLEKMALLKVEGLPEHYTLEGELDLNSSLRPITELARKQGQRAYGANGVTLENLSDNPHSFSFRLMDTDKGTLADLRISINMQGRTVIEMSGFDSGTTAALAMNGINKGGQVPLDWNGRLILNESVEEKLELVQLSLIPNEYESYTFYMGPLLSYYLGDFLTEEETLHDLPPFNLGDETTTHDSNQLARQLVMSENGNILGWWINDRKQALLVRQIGGRCWGSCTTKIFIRNDNQWKEVFSENFDKIWLNKKEVGKPGSEFYTSAQNGQLNRWIWQNDHYVPLDEAEGSP